MPKLRIKELRCQRGISQGELAEKLNVSQSTLSNWESDKYEPDIAILIELSKSFKVSVDYIIGNDITFEDV